MDSDSGILEACYAIVEIWVEILKAGQGSLEDDPNIEDQKSDSLTKS